jgi:hypothetical protein
MHERTADRTEDTVWIRAEIWLDVGDRKPIKVQARRLCCSGAFIEYTGPVQDCSVQVIIPGADRVHGTHTSFGTVLRRLPDGIWVRFTRELRSLSDLLLSHNPDPVPA